MHILTNCTFSFLFHVSLTFQVGVVFLPCGHLATCVSCAPILTNCTFHFHFHSSFQVGVVFLPWGHLATCISCALTLTNCPFTFTFTYISGWSGFSAMRPFGNLCLLRPYPHKLPSLQDSHPSHSSNFSLLIYPAPVLNKYVQYTYIYKSSRSFIVKNMTKGWKMMIVDEINDYGDDFVYLLPKFRYFRCQMFSSQNWPGCSISKLCKLVLSTNKPFVVFTSQMLSNYQRPQIHCAERPM